MNSELRQKVRARDNNQCKFCESTENLHTHHIVPRKAGGSDKKQNLITVCASCHKTIENTQGQALKRIKNEFEQKKKDLKQEFENKYSLDDLIEFFEGRKFRGTIYAVLSFNIITDKPNYEYIGADKEKALNILESQKNGEIKKWYVDAPVAEVLKENQERIEEKVSDDFEPY